VFRRCLPKKTVSRLQNVIPVSGVVQATRFWKDISAFDPTRENGGTLFRSAGWAALGPFCPRAVPPGNGPQ